MAQKSNLIIPDADVIIYLHELNIWSDFIQKYDVYIAHQVYVEAHQYKISDDTTHKLFSINLDESISNDRIISLDAKKIIDIKILLKSYNHAIDEGEEETLAIALYDIPELNVCLRDAAAIKAAVYVGLKSRCISIERAIAQIGLNKQLTKASTDKRFHEIIKAAEIEKIQH
ncbi:MAG: hypothetical protein ACOYVF_10990 [Candidatus Zixiibacteriota bacterium]